MLNWWDDWIPDQPGYLTKIFPWFECTLYTRVHKILSWYDRILKYFWIREIQRKQKKNRTGLLNVGHQRETTIGQLPITIALLRICWFPRITLGTKLSDQYVVPFCLFGLEICPQDMWQHICETSAVAIQLLAVRISKPFPLYLPQWPYLHFYQTQADQGWMFMTMFSWCPIIVKLDQKTVSVLEEMEI